MSALAGLRPPHGGGGRTRPGVRGHPGHRGPQQVGTDSAGFYRFCRVRTPLMGSVCRDGNVSLQEYMAFMISRETENVKSSEEIESAFRALSAENKPYVTKEELYQVGGACAVRSDRFCCPSRSHGSVLSSRT